MIKNLSLSLSLILLLSACGPDRVFESYVEMDNNIWNEDSMGIFEVDIEDTSSAYQINLHVRHNHEYAYRNLYLFVNVIFPNQKALRDTMNVFLAAPSGRWFGDGVGSLKHAKIGYKSEIKFPLVGKYIFTFEHAMRDENLLGMHDLGLEIIRLTSDE